MSEGTDAFVHRWEPRGPEAPTLVLLHGTGGDEDDLIPLGDLLDPSANLLSPRGQVSERGMPRFFRRLEEGVFDMDDLRVRTDGLADFITAAAAHYGFAPARVTAVGFSNGANVAASVLLQRPGVLPRAVLFRAMVPFVPDPLPQLTGTSVFLAAGRRDPIIPAAATEQLADLLRRSGAEVHLHWEDQGHQLTRADVDAARAWLRR